MELLQLLGTFGRGLGTILLLSDIVLKIHQLDGVLTLPDQLPRSLANSPRVAEVPVKHSFIGVPGTSQDRHDINAIQGKTFWRSCSGKTCNGGE